MGAIIAKFRTKKSTLEILEHIEKDINEIEEYRITTQQRQRRFVGNLILYSTLLYIICAVLFFVFYFPSKLIEQLLYSLPLIVFPLLVWSTKKGLQWHYTRQLHRNAEDLLELKRKKKKIIEQVMETETYKVAKQILEKYDPDQVRKKVEYIPRLPNPVNSNPARATPPLPEIRRRNVGSNAGYPMRLSPVPMASRFPAIMSGPMQQGPPPPRPMMQQPMPIMAPPGSYNPRVPRLARPILPQDRTYMDRLVEYIVGDGPGNRYALICKNCSGHNGMALKEEFEYLAFRCCYCYYWNPARKQRPHAPRLPDKEPSPADSRGGSPPRLPDRVSPPPSPPQSVTGDPVVPQEVSESESEDGPQKTNPIDINRTVLLTADSNLREERSPSLVVHVGSPPNIRSLNEEEPAGDLTEQLIEKSTDSSEEIRAPEYPIEESDFEFIGSENEKEMMETETEAEHDQPISVDEQNDEAKSPGNEQFPFMDSTEPTQPSDLTQTSDHDTTLS